YHKDSKGQTIMHLAGWDHVKSEMVKLLLEKGADYESEVDGVLPIEYFGVHDSILFEPYGFVMLPYGMIELLHNKAQKIKEGLSFARTEGKENEALQELKHIVQHFLQMCATKDKDLSDEQKKKQMIKVSDIYEEKIVCRYPSYELLCTVFDKDGVDYLISLITKTNN